MQKMPKFDLPKHSRLMQKSFLVGVATSSFQIEGDLSGREKCIWDTFCDKPEAIVDGSNGQIACDHVSKWQQDIDLIHTMGFDAYRLSISWPRIIFSDGSVNKQGIQFYTDLLSSLKSKGIKTFVTLYHWDLPQYLEDKGGWLNRRTAYAFADYTRVVVKHFNGLVDSYATLNEPFCSAHLGYETGVHAPGLQCRKSSRQAAHHLLLAHGLAMKVLQQDSPNTKNGIVLNFTPCYPVADSDQSAANLANEYINHWYAEPIFKGTYPSVINKLSENERPEIEKSDMEIISQPIDFLGVNYYTRMRYTDDGHGWFRESEDQPLSRTDIGWEIYPQGLTDLLNELNTEYSLPPIYITENGAAYHDKLANKCVDDCHRVAYYQDHLLALHNAIEDGVNVLGYFAWSLMDNFEWAEGYTQRFGIVHVDFESQQRTIKSSGHMFSEYLKQRR